MNADHTRGNLAPHIAGRDALHNLASALAEDVVSAPVEEMVAEMREDGESPRARASEFSRIVARIDQGHRKDRRLRWLTETLGGQLLSSVRRPAMIGVVLVAVLFAVNVAYLQMSGHYDVVPTAPQTIDLPLRPTGRDRQAPLSPQDRPQQVSTVEQIRDYINLYDGGQCFFITPVAIVDGRATIEAFGASQEPFFTLDEAVKRDLGFEAAVAFHLVTEEQCPIVTFLAGLRSPRARAPRLDIDRSVVKDGGPLSGIVDRFGNLNVELLLVSDAGTVQNVTALLRPAVDGKLFSIGMRKSASSESEPRLLAAVASVRPLAALQSRGTAGQVFPAALAEAQQSGQQIFATARYFRFER